MNTKAVVKSAWVVMSAMTALLSAVLSHAHHSVAAVELDKTLEVSGTIKTLEWTNPHAWIWVAVTDPKTGSAQDLGFECPALAMLRRGGWTRDIVKPGDKVEVKYHPLKDGKAGGMFVELQFADGRKLSAMGGLSEAK